MKPFTTASQKCIFCSFRSTSLARNIAARSRPFSTTFTQLDKEIRSPHPRPLTRSAKRRISKDAQHELQIFNNRFRFRQRITTAVLNIGDSLLDPSGIFVRLNLDSKELRKHYQAFKDELFDVVHNGHLNGATNVLDNDLLRKWERIRRAALSDDLGALEVETRYCLYGAILNGTMSKEAAESQTKLVNLAYPAEWWPFTRNLKRTFHLHVGPTNSGKTYHALKRLEQAKTGIYAGPLRLLAYEVYTRLNARGRHCHLVTGDDRRLPVAVDMTAPEIVSCTVEMIPLNTYVDVAVIDEIQLIADSERGWAWTQGVFGVKAKEVHLCGEERAVSLIRDLAASTGDEVIVHKYERLTGLRMDDTSLKGDLTKVRKGDAIICFTIANIHMVRDEIERRTLKKCAIIYGSLPPETRSQQAELFNNPDNEYDYLVASDAVGMGLNLSIKRIIFHATTKFNGEQVIQLGASQIKQIAGRAGRYKTSREDIEASKNANNVSGSESPLSSLDVEVPKPELDDGDSGAAGLQDAVVLGAGATRDSAAPDMSSRAPKDESRVGLITTLYEADYKVVKSVVSETLDDIQTAGIVPPDSIVERFARYFPPSTPFSYLLLRLYEIGTYNDTRFHLCNLRTMLSIADCIEGVEGLSIEDRMVLVMAPIEPRKGPRVKKLACELARAVADRRSTHILELETLNIEGLTSKEKVSKETIRMLEDLHSGLVLFNWLSYRFPTIFVERQLSDHVKEQVEAKIEQTLQQLHYVDSLKHKRLMEREKRLLAQGLDPNDWQDKQEWEADEELDIEGSASAESMVETGHVRHARANVPA